MEQVEIFCEIGEKKLQQKINDWLKANAARIEITDRRITSSNSTITVAIFYKVK
jgi:hypothetical protein